MWSVTAIAIVIVVVANVIVIHAFIRLFVVSDDIFTAEGGVSPQHDK